MKGKMPLKDMPKGKHKMPNGSMMPDKEMKMKPPKGMGPKMMNKKK